MIGIDAKKEEKADQFIYFQNWITPIFLDKSWVQFHTHHNNLFWSFCFSTICTFLGQQKGHVLYC